MLPTCLYTYLQIEYQWSPRNSPQNKDTFNQPGPQRCEDEDNSGKKTAKQE